MSFILVAIGLTMLGFALYVVASRVYLFMRFGRIKVKQGKKELYVKKGEDE